MPIERGVDEPIEAFLYRIIGAVIRSSPDHELRVKEDTIDIETRQLIVQDFDPATNEIVFRLGSKYAQATWVNPRQSAWTIPFEERSRQLGLDVAARHAIPTDEDLAEKERIRAATKRSTRPIAPAS
jgi:hypothetical protein